MSKDNWIEITDITFTDSCPGCGGTDFYCNEGTQLDEAGAFEELDCNSCGCNWINSFNYASTTVLVTPDFKIYNYSGQEVT